jgi:hypothetical protein
MEALLRQQQIDRYSESVDRIETGFVKVNGYNGSPPDEEWSQHLENDTPPNMSVSWRQYVSMSKDPIKAAADAFRAFKVRNGAAPTTIVKSPVSDPSRQVAPSRSTPPPIEPQGSLSPEEHLVAIQREYEKGKIDEKEMDKQSRPLLQKLGMIPAG